MASGVMKLIYKTIRFTKCRTFSDDIKLSLEMYCIHDMMNKQKMKEPGETLKLLNKRTIGCVGRLCWWCEMKPIKE